MSYTPVCLNCERPLVDKDGIEIQTRFCSISCAASWAIDVTETYEWNSARGRWKAEGISCDAVICAVCLGGVRYDKGSKWYCMTCEDTVEIVPNIGVIYVQS